jgi:hypothetical protein
MLKFLENLTNRFRPRSKPARTLKPHNADDLTVIVPQSVELPLPREARQEISVPASINGRDLSTGRL